MNIQPTNQDIGRGGGTRSAASKAAGTEIKQEVLILEANSMAKINIRLPEPKEEYDVSNQKQINRAIALITEQLNSHS